MPDPPDSRGKSEVREKGKMDGERNALKGKGQFQPGRRTDGDRLPLCPPNNRGERDDMNDELWHACAGRSVYVPRVGEKVMYFPQGHMEQVDACMNHDGTTEMPIYNLPYKILCGVLHVHLKVEPGTDEVFAQITLVPEAEQDERNVVHLYYKSFPRKARSQFFSKKLTPSDTSTHGGFSIPKRLADDGCLPPLDMSQQTPQQELVAIDLHGLEWRFRHIFRGQPKRHLLTGGWSTFLTSKKLVSGDICIFLRGENGELGVGIRRATTTPNHTSTSIISGHSMRHGILASAFHAYSTRSMFTVYHRPWSSSSEFIVPLDQYVKSAETDYSIGQRFRMQVDGEECGEQSLETRASGTIIGIEDVDHIRWPNSEWKCLKVKWDSTTSAISLPERVSPWNIELMEFIDTGKRMIEPMELTDKEKPFIPHNPKKARTGDASSPGFSSLMMDGIWHGSIKYNSQSTSGVLQGQEDSDTDGNQSGALRQPLPHCPPRYHRWASMQQQMQMPDFCASCFSGGKVPRNKNETSLRGRNGGHAYMLFGVNLVDGPSEPPSPQLLTSSELESLCSIPPTSHSTVSEPSKGTSSMQSNNSCSIRNRSCTKVLKYETALGRSVDLTRFDGYKDLICELDHMFDFNGRLIDGSSGWHATYTNEEGDMMTIGDHYPWQKFQYGVRKMLITPKEEMERPNPSSTSSTSY